MRYLISKPFFYLTHSLGNKGADIFLKGNNLKVNAIARLEFELINFDATVQQFNQFAMRTSFLL